MKGLPDLEGWFTMKSMFSRLFSLVWDFRILLGSGAFEKDEGVAGSLYCNKCGAEVMKFFMEL